jgi:hypothetical protein
MPVDRLSGISFKDHSDFLLHLRKVDGGRIPDFGDIDTEVVVDKDMPHSYNILPGDRSVRFTKSGGKAVCCFPNDLDVIDYPDLEQVGTNAFFLCVRQLFMDPADRCRDTGSRSRSVLIRGSLPVSLSDGNGR